MQEITEVDIEDMKRNLLNKYSNEQRYKDFKALQFEINHPYWHKFFRKKSMKVNFELQQAAQKIFPEIVEFKLSQSEKDLIICIRKIINEIGGKNAKKQKNRK